MKKIIFILIGVMTFSAAKADEGMWLLNMLNRIYDAEMKQMGLNLTPEEIYSINNASMKDAIVRLNGGMCTAEIISKKGLVLTNHHCAYGSVQALSSTDNDFLTEGFWAKSHAEEMPIPDFVVSFLVRIEPMSDQILKELNDDMSEMERQQKIHEVIQTLTAKAQEGTTNDIEIKDFFHGNEFYLFEYKTYRDVRLVGVPPESIGKFGGDTDNWMWPRHTGDFSMIRIYSDKDNKPADFTKENIPYTPAHSLPISLDGVQKGDFAMILGYPGSTDRFLSSAGVQQAIDVYNPSVVEIRDLKLQTMKKHMNADPAVRLKYAAKHAQTANYWKYYIGQTKGLKALDVFGQKKAIEDEFEKWANAEPTRKAKYGNTVQSLNDYYKSTDASIKGQVYVLEAGLIGSDLNLFAFRFARTYEASKQAEGQDKINMLANYMPAVGDFFKDYDQATDKDLWVNLMSMYKKNISNDQLPTIFETIDKDFGGSVQAFADQMYATSFTVDHDKMMEFLRAPNDSIFDNDLAVQAANSLIEKYRSYMVNPEQEKFDTGYRLLVDGLRKMDPNKLYSPDANSTMRLTYGQVLDYYPADAMHYNFYTTTNGILQKMDNTDHEFQVHPRLQKLIEEKDFGRWANEDGELVTCFLSNNDITGGNSGSPVINGDGYLIGVAFDGNWEAMSGDIAFEPTLQRTISVDIRYVLFVVDKFAGATNLIDEMDFRSGERKNKKKCSKRLKKRLEKKQCYDF